jgi:hypothetical protein
MKQVWWFSGFGMICSSVGCMLQASPPPPLLDSASPPVPVQYIKQTHARSQVHLLIIPPGHPVTIGVAPELKPVEQFAHEAGAIAALNAGFFDPVNQQTTSYVIQDGKQTADPRQNDRLMQNPQLTNYLDRILNRSEFRIYRCVAAVQSAIAPRNTPVPSNCQLQQAIGAGPQLLPEMTAEIEGFVDPKTGRDALGSEQPNARSAIGIKPDGTIVWLLAAQLATRTEDTGMTLTEVAAVLRSLGVTAALNLDGGSSSSLYYADKTSAKTLLGQSISGKFDQFGQPIRRPVKSVLLLQPIQPPSQGAKIPD